MAELDDFLLKLDVSLAKLRSASIEQRVLIYNAVVRAAAERLLHDLPTDPCCSPQLLLADAVLANDYNPNRVADPELELLQQSIEADGLTMPVVVSPVAQHHEVVDGFHRRLVAKELLGRSYIPCSIIRSSRGDRMASTVRHNRARGKHQVDLQGALVTAMCRMGLSDDEIATKLGMSPEELLRLKQIQGAAKLIAGVEYSTTYGRTDEPPDMPDE